MPTSYIDRFGKGSALLHAYADDNSPRATEIQPLFDVMNLQEAQTVLNVPFEGNLLTRIQSVQNMRDNRVQPSTVSILFLRYD